MKFLLSLSLIITSLNAWAFPKEGDFARYLATHKGEVYEYKRHLVEYYPDKDAYLHVIKLSLNETTISERWTILPKMWFYTEEKVQNVLNTCLRREGALETVILNEQRIKACTFHNEDAQLDYTIGMVPFGQLRFQEYLGNGEFLDFYLVDFR